MPRGGANKRRADLLNALRVLIRRCRIKVFFNSSSDKGIELRVSIRSVTGVMLASSSLGTAMQPRARTRRNASTPLSSALACRKLPMHYRDPVGLTTTPIVGDEPTVDHASV